MIEPVSQASVIVPLSNTWLNSLVKIGNSSGRECFMYSFDILSSPVAFAFLSIL